MAALTVDFRKHSGPTPADDMAAQSSLTVELHTGLQVTWILCLSTLPPDSGSWFQMKCKIYFHLKRGLWTHWATVQFFFSTAQVRCFWHCLWFEVIGSPFSWRVWAWWLLMHRIQLQSTPCEALPGLNQRAYAWLYSQACGHPCCLWHLFLPKFFLPVNFVFNMLDTALCKPPHLSVMTFCDLPSLWRVSMFVFWIIASQQSSPLLWFQEQEIPRMYMCMDGHLLKLKCKYSNIWDTDFWLSWAVSSYHQIKQKKNFWNVLLYM